MAYIEFDKKNDHRRNGYNSLERVPKAAANLILSRGLRRSTQRPGQLVEDVSMMFASEQNLFSLGFWIALLIGFITFFTVTASRLHALIQESNRYSLGGEIPTWKAGIW